MFNSTTVNTSMYMGRNFVDILFQYVMENGMAKFSFVALLQLYLYLSLDRIQSIFKSLNDYIGELCKKYFEIYKLTYGTIIKEKSMEYYSWIRDQSVSQVKNFIQRKLYPDTIQNFHVTHTENTEDNCIPKITLNRIYVNINTDNRIDLMAMGNFFLQMKEYINFNSYTRIVSDQQKSTQSYILPNTIIINYDQMGDFVNDEIKDDLKIIFNQNVNMVLSLDSNNRIEILKDVILEKKINDKIIILSNDDDMATIFRSLLKFPKEIKAAFPHFEPKMIKNYYCCPSNIISSEYTSIIFYIYYSKNYELFKSFIKFFEGKGIFIFDGKKYKLSSGCLNSSLKKLKDPSGMAEFIIELEKYCDKELIPAFSSNSEIIDNWINSNKQLFKSFEEKEDKIKITFESVKMSRQNLLSYSTYFFNHLVKSYFTNSSNRINDKISIYQLNIKYKTQNNTVPNPAYVKWAEKYEDAKKEEDKVDAKEKESSNKSNSDTQKPDNLAYPFPIKSYRIPVAPSKTIEEIKYIPFAEANIVRSDKKPFEYLYLQKDQKDLLHSYVNHFKNDKESFYRMGIPYKGGILLDGVPGCGKSSTIMAIGTFLDKNIYYLDLGKIKTNQEFKLCVDYVRTNSQKGGIIIFEDIDCMTDVVKRRDINIEIGALCGESEMNDKLSLSFILNVLDGVLSPENIIFIMTTNHKEKLDPALIRPGRMDININIDKCTKYQLEQIYVDLYNRPLNPEIANKFREKFFITSEVIMHLFHNTYNKNISEEELLKKFLN